MVFFFQAEDGIRDPLVTGVQTCALPISACCVAGLRVAVQHAVRIDAGEPERYEARTRLESEPVRGARSEERRVGKECRFRWAPRHDQKERAMSITGAYRER